MIRIKSTDPRARKTRQALTKSVKELMGLKNFNQITVSDITERAGVARHTFYNHFDTKADILDYLVDSVLESFFSVLNSWDLFNMEADQELALFEAFFKAWKDHPEITRLLETPVMEPVILERMKAFFTRFYEGIIQSELPEVDPKLADYMISFNAYSLVGILKSWVDSGMEDSPKHLAGFLYVLTGSRQRLKVVREYQGLLSK
jgi:AcrR family transcriptional regulator